MDAVEEECMWDAFLPLLLEKISRNARTEMNNYVSEYGISSAQTMHLVALYKSDGQTLLSLSRFLDVDVAITNRTVKVLKEKGLVYDDRRTPSSKKFQLFLTDEGRTLVEQYLHDVSSVQERNTGGLTNNDLVRARNTLIHLSNNLEDFRKEEPKVCVEAPFYTHFKEEPLLGDPEGANLGKVVNQLSVGSRKSV